MAMPDLATMEEEERQREQRRLVKEKVRGAWMAAWGGGGWDGVGLMCLGWCTGGGFTCAYARACLCVCVCVRVCMHVFPGPSHQTNLPPPPKKNTHTTQAEEYRRAKAEMMTSTTSARAAMVETGAAAQRLKVGREGGMWTSVGWVQMRWGG